MRKSGKLPGENYRATFSKEYGEDVFEMAKDAVKPGQKVIVIE